MVNLYSDLFLVGRSRTLAFDNSHIVNVDELVDVEIVLRSQIPRSGLCLGGNIQTNKAPARRLYIVASGTLPPTRALRILYHRVSVYPDCNVIKSVHN